MQHRKLIWQIFPANILITFFTVAAVTWYGSTAIRDFYMAEMEAGLLARAHLISESVSALLGEDSVESLRAFCVRTGRLSSTRITVVDPSGMVVADSNESPASMDNHKTRPEIIQALRGQCGASLRYSRTLDQNMLYVAIALPQSAAVLRLSIPVTALDQILASVQRKIAWGAVPVFCLSVLITLIVSRRISQPLERMREIAGSYADGDFRNKMSGALGMSASQEVIALAAAMDQLTVQLNKRIRIIDEQRNELETVFSSMVEAVVAVDSQWRVVRLNRAAAALFRVDRLHIQGRMFQELVRHSGLEQQIGYTLKSGEARETEISLDEGDRHLTLDVHAVAMRDGDEQNLGALLVINDVTQLRQLENVRRDFVANVSHELKTPVTSIKGYVETLLDGALEDHGDAVRFLSIVQEQTERLHAIIEDLLSLSRIETRSQEETIIFVRGRLQPVLQEAIALCRLKAEANNISLTLSCSDSLVTMMNSGLLQQAVVNLVANAITYSENGGTVHIRAEESVSGQKDGVLIRVEDQGIGMEEQHLARIFERFYTADKARSRKSGGTGLGLAIVKHIAHSHGGEVTVQSEKGKGSCFFIHLPLARA